MEIKIEHDIARCRFWCSIDGKECYASYDLVENGTIMLDLYKTYVHPDLRGRGIAEILLKAFSEFAINNKYSVNPSCSYAVTFYKRHPEFCSVLPKNIDLDNGGSCRI